MPIQHHAPIFISDTPSLAHWDLSRWVKNFVGAISEDVYLPASRVEAILDYVGWDPTVLKTEDIKDIIARANMCEKEVLWPAFDQNPSEVSACVDSTSGGDADDCVPNSNLTDDAKPIAYTPSSMTSPLETSLDSQYSINVNGAGAELGLSEGTTSLLHAIDEQIYKSASFSHIQSNFHLPPVHPSSSSSPTSRSRRKEEHEGFSSVLTQPEMSIAISSVEDSSSSSPISPKEAAKGISTPSPPLPPPPSSPMLISPSRSEQLDTVSPTLESLAAQMDAVATSPIPERPDFEENVECVICGEIMLAPIAAYDVVHNDAVYEKERRQVQCPAGHKFCLSCWRGSLQVQVRESSAIALQCPSFKCGERLDDQIWTEAILEEQDLIDRFRQRRLSHIVDCCSRLRQCPGRDCGLVLCVEIENLSVTCKACGEEIVGGAICDIDAHVCKAAEGSGVAGFLSSLSLFGTSKAPVESSSSSSSATATSGTSGDKSRSWSRPPRTAICGNGHAICLHCDGSAHAPVSCEAYEQWMTRVREQMKDHGVEGIKDSNDIANALWLAANCKKCPKCSTPIEKDEGCNHMTCRKCRYDFCWICMQPWNLHSNSTGGYFQCNRFVDDESQNDGIGEGKEGKKSVPTGNAHEETLRMRAQGKSMAKFIHYYTRFRAHEESAALETRIRKETIMRIKVNMRRSDRGDLVWLQRGAMSHPYETLNQEEAISFKLLDDDIELICGSSSAAASGDSVESVANIFHSSRERNKRSGSPKKSFSFSKRFSLFRTPEKKREVSSNTPVSVSEANDSTYVEMGSEISNKLHVSSGDPLLFLSNGFQELLSCRHLLKGSFPYAFYAFDDEIPDTNDLEALYNYMERSGMGYNLEIVSSRKQAFETLQSELEVVVEMLSDVVARKRLRASKAEIEQMTKSARSKRIELEEFIRQTDKMIANNAKDVKINRGDVGSGILDFFMGSRTTRSGRQRASSQGSYRSRRLSQRYLVEPHEPDRPRPLNPANHIEAMAQLRAAEERVQRRREQVDQRRRSRSIDSPSGGNPGSPDVTSNNSRNSQNEMMTNRRFTSFESLSSLVEDLPQEDHDSGDDRGGDDYEMRAHAMQIRFEEEEQLNRAILLSLQSDLSAVGSSTAERSGREESECEFVPSEEHMDTLRGMGFPDEQARDALRRQGDNLDRAINDLIGM